MRLGEIVDYDSVELCDYRRTIHRPHVSFYLPIHKADSFFKGSTVVFEKGSSDLDPIQLFQNLPPLERCPTYHNYGFEVPDASQPAHGSSTASADFSL